MKTTYLGQFSADSEPPDDESLEYADWSECQDALAFYLAGDAGTETPIVAMFDSHEQAALVLTTTGLAHHGHTKLYLVKNGQDWDLSCDIPVADLADAIGASQGLPQWKVEVTISSREDNKYTMAHTINHEVSLHAGAYLQLFNQVGRLLTPPASSSEIRTQQIQSLDALLVGALTGTGFTTDEARHRMFAERMNDQWRIYMTHAAMRKSLQARRLPVDTLDKDFADDRAARAAELGITLV